MCLCDNGICNLAAPDHIYSVRHYTDTTLDSNLHGIHGNTVSTQLWNRPEPQPSATSNVASKAHPINHESRTNTIRATIHAPKPLTNTVFSASLIKLCQSLTRGALIRNASILYALAGPLTALSLSSLCADWRVILVYVQHTSDIAHSYTDNSAPLSRLITRPSSQFNGRNISIEEHAQTHHMVLALMPIAWNRMTTTTTTTIRHINPINVERRWYINNTNRPNGLTGFCVERCTIETIDQSTLAAMRQIISANRLPLEL